MHGVAKASETLCAARRRRGFGAVAAPGCVATGHSFFLKFLCVCVVTLAEARRDLFLQCNAGADVVQAHMWCVATLGEARRGYFSQCK